MGPPSVGRVPLLPFVYLSDTVCMLNASLLDSTSAASPPYYSDAEVVKTRRAIDGAQGARMSTQEDCWNALENEHRVRFYLTPGKFGL